MSGISNSTNKLVSQTQEDFENRLSKVEEELDWFKRTVLPIMRTMSPSAIAPTMSPLQEKILPVKESIVEELVQLFNSNRDEAIPKIEEVLQWKNLSEKGTKTLLLLLAPAYNDAENYDAALMKVAEALKIQNLGCVEKAVLLLERAKALNAKENFQAVLATVENVPNLVDLPSNIQGGLLCELAKAINAKAAATNELFEKSREELFNLAYHKAKNGLELKDLNNEIKAVLLHEMDEAIKGIEATNKTKKGENFCIAANEYIQEHKFTDAEGVIEKGLQYENLPTDVRARLLFLKAYICVNKHEYQSAIEIVNRALLLHCSGNTRILLRQLHSEVTKELKKIIEQSQHKQKRRRIEKPISEESQNGSGLLPPLSLPPAPSIKQYFIGEEEVDQGTIVNKDGFNSLPNWSPL